MSKQSDDDSNKLNSNKRNEILVYIENYSQMKSSKNTPFFCKHEDSTKENLENMNEKNKSVLADEISHTQYPYNTFCDEDEQSGSLLLNVSLLFCTQKSINFL